MSEAVNAYAESTGRSTTTSAGEGAVNKVRLTHTPGSNEKWLYLWNAVVDYGATTGDVQAQFENATIPADWANYNIEPQDTTNRMSVGGIKVHTYGASPGSQDIDLDFGSESAIGSTAGIADAHIFGLLLTSDDKSAENNSQQDDSAGASTFVTALTLAETLTGDYLFLCSCEYQINSSSADIIVRADKGGTKYGSVTQTFQDSSTWRTWATGFKLTGLSGSQTVTLEFATDTDAVRASVRKCCILALKLSRFNKNGYDEDRTRDTNATSTPEDQSSLAFTPDATRNHIAIAGMVLDHNNATTNGFGEFERDGAAINQHQEEPNEASDECPFFSLRRESLTSGVATTYKTQKWSETTNTTGAAESWIIVIDLEEASAGSIGAAAGTGAASGVGGSTAASTASASGAGTVSGIGAGTAASAGAAAGTGAATAAGTGIVAAAGSADGTSTAAAAGAVVGAGDGAATGTGAATAAGASTAASAGSAAGVGAASGGGESTAASVGAAAGAGAAAAAGAATAATTGDAAGNGAGTGTGASTAAGVGSAAGAGTATAVGSTAGDGAGDGAASGVGTATGVGAATAAAQASSAGSGAASAVGTAVQNSAGAAAGNSSVAAIGASTSAAVGAVIASADALAIGTAFVAAIGAAVGLGAAAAVSSGDDDAPPLDIAIASGNRSASVTANRTAASNLSRSTRI